MDKTANGFTTAISQTQTEAVTFDWWASVKTEGQKQPIIQGLEQPEEKTAEVKAEPTEENNKVETNEPENSPAPVTTQAGEVAGAESEATPSGEVVVSP